MESSLFKTSSDFCIRKTEIMVYKRKSMEKKKEGMGSTIDQNLSFKNIMKDVALFGKHSLHLFAILFG
jgi:hypothetical protein